MRRASVSSLLLAIIASGSYLAKSEKADSVITQINKRRGRYYLSQYRREQEVKKNKLKRRTRGVEITTPTPPTTTTTRQSIFEASNTGKNAGRADSEEHIYVNAQTGNDSNNGSTLGTAVKSLSRALTLVKNKSRPLNGNLIINLSGTFSMEQLKVRDAHRGTSATKRVIFRGDDDGLTTLLGGKSLNFVKGKVLKPGGCKYHIPYVLTSNHSMFTKFCY